MSKFIGQFRGIYDKGINGTVVDCADKMLVIRDAEGKLHTAQITDTYCIFSPDARCATNRYRSNDRMNIYR